MECPQGDTVYHNTTLEGTKQIVESGRIRAGSEGALGQDVISLSSCPAQHYGGNVKLVVDARGLKLRPMCYYGGSEYKEVDRGVEKEAHQKTDGVAGVNRVRAKYAINYDMYNNECEAVAYEHIPISRIKKIEYWIPWQVDERYSFSTGCAGTSPAYSHGEYRDPVKQVQENIAQAKVASDKIRVPLEVKSCFTALKTGWGDQYIPLNDRTLKMLEKGRTPATVQGKVPQLCRC